MVKDKTIFVNNWQQARQTVHFNEQYCISFKLLHTEILSSIQETSFCYFNAVEQQHKINFLFTIYCVLKGRFCVFISYNYILIILNLRKLSQIGRQQRQMFQLLLECISVRKSCKKCCRKSLLAFFHIILLFLPWQIWPRKMVRL